MQRPWGLCACRAGGKEVGDEDRWQPGQEGCVGEMSCKSKIFGLWVRRGGEWRLWLCRQPHAGYERQCLSLCGWGFHCSVPNGVTQSQCSLSFGQLGNLLLGSVVSTGPSKPRVAVSSVNLRSTPYSSVDHLVSHWPSLASSVKWNLPHKANGFARSLSGTR